MDDFSQAERASEKQASRDDDQRRRESGDACSREIALENDFFASVDWTRFRITAIGDQPIERADPPAE